MLGHIFFFIVFDFLMYVINNFINGTFKFMRVFLVMASTLLRVSSSHHWRHFSKYPLWPPFELSLEQFTMALEKLYVNFILLYWPFPMSNFFRSWFSPSMRLSIHKIIIITIVLSMCFLFHEICVLIIMQFMKKILKNRVNNIDSLGILNNISLISLNKQFLKI